MLYLRALNCLHVKSAREIFFDFFDDEECANFDFTWRSRERSRSVGLFTRDGDLLGFTLVKGNRLEYIVVDKGYQGQNFGSLLLSYILSLTIRSRRSLSLTPVNAPRLIDWYKKHGFREEVLSESNTPGVPFRVLSFHSYGTRAHAKALSQYA